MLLGHLGITFVKSLFKYFVYSFFFFLSCWSLVLSPLSDITENILAFFFKQVSFIIEFENKTAEV